MQGWQIENCMLYVVAVLMIIGAFYFGVGALGLFGLACLLMVNTSKGDKSQEA